MLKQGFQPVSMQLSSMGEVAGCWQHLFVDGKDLVQGSLIDVQCWKGCTYSTAISSQKHSHSAARSQTTCHNLMQCTAFVKGATSTTKWVRHVKRGGEGALTWKKIIANQHAEQYKIVDDMFQTEGEWKSCVLEFQLHIIPHKPAEQEPTMSDEHESW